MQAWLQRRDEMLAQGRREHVVAIYAKMRPEAAAPADRRARRQIGRRDPAPSSTPRDRERHPQRDGAGARRSARPRRWSNATRDARRPEEEAVMREPALACVLRARRSPAAPPISQDIGREPQLTPSAPASPHARRPVTASLGEAEHARMRRSLLGRHQRRPLPRSARHARSAISSPSTSRSTTRRTLDNNTDRSPRFRRSTQASADRSRLVPTKLHAERRSANVDNSLVRQGQGHRSTAPRRSSSRSRRIVTEVLPNGNLVHQRLAGGARQLRGPRAQRRRHRAAARHLARQHDLLREDRRGAHLLWRPRPHHAKCSSRARPAALSTLFTPF